jgi:hypothetical protein
MPKGIRRSFICAAIKERSLEVSAVQTCNGFAAQMWVPIKFIGFVHGDVGRPILIDRSATITLSARRFPLRSCIEFSLKQRLLACQPSFPKKPEIVGVPPPRGEPAKFLTSEHGCD